MTDIVERLRATQFDKDNMPRMKQERWFPVGLALEAADEIERLRADNYRIGYALEEIIQSADGDDSEYGAPTSGWYCISTHLIDRARSALSAKPVPQGETP
jgi:hypothetical protein